MCYALIPNVEMLTSYTSLAVQLKILLSFIALFYLRWKAPDLERPVKVSIDFSEMASLCCVLYYKKQSFVVFFFC